MDDVLRVDIGMVIEDCLEKVDDLSIRQVIIDEDTGLKVIFTPHEEGVLALVINKDKGVGKIIATKWVLEYKEEEE